MTVPTFFYQTIAVPPKAALDVQEPVHDFQGSGPQVPPAFFEPEPLYFLEGIAAQLDPFPLGVAVASFTGAFATTQHYPIWEFPDLTHIYNVLSHELGPFFLMPFLDKRTVSVSLVLDITTGDVLRVRGQLTEGSASIRTVADGSGLSVTLHEFT